MIINQFLLNVLLTHERHRPEPPEDVDEAVPHHPVQLLHAAIPEQHRLARDLLGRQLQVVGAVCCLLASR